LADVEEVVLLEEEEEVDMVEVEEDTLAVVVVEVEVEAFVEEVAVEVSEGVLVHLHVVPYQMKTYLLILVK
jgi:SepF-like predicted cell division protein (DUF552 family)